MNRMGLGLMAVMVVISTAACGDDGSESGASATPTPNLGNVTFSDVQAVLDEHCVTCHYGNDLQLGAGDVRGNLLAATTSCVVEGEVVEKPVVTPGDLENSTLWHKTANVDLDCGREMPANGQGGLIAEDPAGFAVIEAWIQAGAPE
jgi:hypothetical protein